MRHSQTLFFWRVALFPAYNCCLVEWLCMSSSPENHIAKLLFILHFSFSFWEWFNVLRLLPLVFSVRRRGACCPSSLLLSSWISIFCTLWTSYTRVFMWSQTYLCEFLLKFQINSELSDNVDFSVSLIWYIIWYCTSIKISIYFWWYT